MLRRTRAIFVTFLLLAGSALAASAQRAPIADTTTTTESGETVAPMTVRLTLDADARRVLRDRVGSTDGFVAGTHAYRLPQPVARDLIGNPDVDATPVNPDAPAEGPRAATAEPQSTSEPKPTSNPQRSIAVRKAGGCQSYSITGNLRQGDECKDVGGDASVNDQDLGNKITRSYAVLGSTRGPYDGRATYEWEPPGDLAGLFLQVRLGTDEAYGSVTMNFWDPNQQQWEFGRSISNSDVGENNTTFRTYELSDQERREYAPNGYFAIQIVTDDGWWVDYADTEWTEADPAIDVTPTSLDYGTVQTGEQATKDVTIENTGNADLSVEPIIQGTDADQFDLSPLQSTTIQPGDQFTYSVTYAPSTSGSHDARLAIRHTADNEPSPIDVDLSGTAEANAKIDVNIQPIRFGRVLATGDEEEARSVEVTNSGGGTLGVEPGFDGPDAGEFSLLQPRSEELGAGETATFTILYDPSSADPDEAFFELNHTADNLVNPVSIDMTGRGVEAEEINIESADWTIRRGEAFTFEGTVRDGDGNPIENVEIGAEDPFALASFTDVDQTNANGDFSYAIDTTVPRGFYTIVLYADADTYTAVTVAITEDGSTNRVTLQNVNVPIGVLGDVSLAESAQLVSRRVAGNYLSPTSESTLLDQARDVARGLQDYGKDTLRAIASDPQIYVAAGAAVTCAVSGVGCLAAPVLVKSSITGALATESLINIIDRTGLSAQEKEEAKEWVDRGDLAYGFVTFSDSGAIIQTGEALSLTKSSLDIIRNEAGDIRGIVASGTNGDQKGRAYCAVPKTSDIPVEMAGFDASADGQAATLTWTTASESGNAGFAVQHRTPDDSTWTKEGFVEGHGTKASASDYRYEVSDLTPGTHRFRLRQVDQDGSSTITEPVTVRIRMQQNVRLTAYPNPVRGQSTIRLAVKRAQPVTVALYDALGRRVRVVYDGDVPAEQTEKMAVQASTLSSGRYFIRVRGEHVTATQPVSVVH